MNRILPAVWIAMLFCSPLAARESGVVRPIEDLLRAIDLPAAAEEARRAGVPAGEVREVLEAARGRRVPAGEAQIVFEEETRAVKEKGTIDDFGAFVKSKLDQGLRGRELAEAIRAEHAARGRGKGNAAGGDREKPEARGEAGKRTRRPGMEPIEAGEDDERLAKPSKPRGKRGEKKPAEDTGR